MNAQFAEWSRRFHRVRCKALFLGLNEDDADRLAQQYADAQEELD